MKRFNFTFLLKELEPHRNEVAELDAELVPKSAAILISLLAAEVDSTLRFQFYLHAVGECRLAGRTAAAVKLAHARYQEFQDVASLKVYSEALADSTQAPREGDCALEADWADEAEALGADKDLISWVRAVAERR